MSQYKSLREKSPKLNIKENANEIIFTLISCMCDNKSYLKLRKKNDKTLINHYNDYCSLSLSNLQMEDGYKDNLIWAFDENDYDKVINIINSGTSVISEVKSR